MVVKISDHKPSTGAINLVPKSDRNYGSLSLFLHTLHNPNQLQLQLSLFPSINITKAYDHSSFTRTECHNLSFTIKRNPTLRARKAWKIAAIEDVSGAVADPAPIVVTWQIVVGAIAGVTPFVVAGIEFSKRIIAQKRCEVCGGSGLVLTKENYMKCPGCGGFLPWQSWKRFFTG